MRLLLLLLIISQNCFAQSSPKVLVVPLENYQIIIEQKSSKVLKRNRVSEDSAKRVIRNYSLSAMYSNLSHCSIVLGKQFTELNFLKDSLAVMEQFNSFYWRGVAGSKGIENAILQTNLDVRKVYFGRLFSNKEVNVLKQVIAAQQVDYFILTNRFDINSPGFLPHQICYHVEVYDKEMQLIFGGKSGTSYEFSKSVYFGVLNYYYKSAANEVFSRVGNLLKQ